MSVSKQVAATAAAFLSGKLDALTTIRRILEILGDVDRCTDRGIMTTRQGPRRGEGLPEVRQRRNRQGNHVLP